MASAACLGLLTLSASIFAQVNLVREPYGRGLWLYGTTELKNEYDTREIRGGTSGDFDSDGREEIIIALAVELEVSWNSASGLEGLKSLDTGKGGEWGHIAWDSTHRILWAERHYPHAIEAYRFEERQLQLVQTFKCNATSFRLTTGVGVTAQDRATKQLYFFDHTGNKTLLEVPGDEAMDAALLSPLGEGGQLVFQDAESGGLWLTAYAGNGWSEPEWWEGTDRSRQWDAQSLGDGRTLVLGGNDTSMWGRIVGGPRGATTAWNKPFVLRDIDFWMRTNPDSKKAELFLWNAVTSGSVMRLVDAETGLFDATAVVDEVDGLQLVLRPDLDGDGQKDYFHPMPNLAQWKHYIPWGNATRRIFASIEPIAAAELEELPLTTQWKVAISELEGVHEIWTRNSELLVKRGNQWSVLIPQRQEGAVQERFEQVEDEEKRLLLNIPYLEIDQNPRSSGSLAEIEVDRWYHLVYQRDSKLNTEVWLDGACLFKGKSKDLGYAHNRIIFGAGFGRFYTSFAGISLDEFALFAKFLDEETIGSISRLEYGQEPMYLTEFWNFENSSFSGGFSKDAAQKISFPKRTTGVIGTAVTFDGIDDALRVFAPISKQEMAVSCFFRVDQKGLKLAQAGQTIQSLFTLYGLYNIGMGIYYEPLSNLVEAPADGPVLSPVLHRVEDAGFPSGTQLVHLADADVLVDSTGTIFQFSDTGWVRQADRGQLPRSLQGVPWSEGSCLYLTDGSCNVYDWSESEGWIRVGWTTDRDFSPVLASQNGVFFQSKTAWKWLDQGQSKSFNPIDATGTLRSIQWTVKGDNLSWGKDRHLVWNATNRKKALKPDARFFNATSGWALNAVYWLIRIALGSALVLFLFRKRIMAWRERRENQASAALLWSTVPPEIKVALLRLAEFPNGTFDTSDMDAILSPSSADSDETRRARRSRFVRECNLWGESVFGISVIDWKRDQSDRRRRVYFIRPEIARLISSKRNGAKD